MAEIRPNSSLWPPRASAPADRSGASRASCGQRVRTWSRRRRVVAKAEWTKGEGDAQLRGHLAAARDESKAKHLYEKVYCARGDMENLGTRSASSTSMRTAPRPPRCAPTGCICRFHSNGLCAALCPAPELASGQTPSSRKAACPGCVSSAAPIGALVRVSVRRIRIAMASACPAAQASSCPPPARDCRIGPCLARLTHAAAARPSRGTTHRPTETRKKVIYKPRSSAPRTSVPPAQKPSKSRYALHNPSVV